jgi:DNA primase
MRGVRGCYFVKQRGMALTPQWLDELRARTSLSALIGRSIKVTKAGREYKACCPFHNEKTPSFTINDEKGFYHCFGCSAHGDAIRWMTDQRGLSFMDAVKELADNAGMEVPAPDPRAAKQAQERAGLHDVMAAAQAFFEKHRKADGSEASAYLTRRGFSDDIVNRFGFGFAPDSRTALRSALQHFGDPMLIEAGLLIKVDDKDPYDRFRGRLMIPIRDARGRVIAFGGRSLGDGEPKYLNSPDTPLFDKGRTLYNLDRCSPASRSSGRVIVVEGYMDVIALAQGGFHDAVAPLGTALTEQQLQMLWRMTDKPLICFDGDAAGKKAAYRAALRALPMIEPGSSLRFVDLPKGQDPDDILQQNNGKQAMDGAFERAQSLADFIWTQERAKFPFGVRLGPDDRISLRDNVEKIAQTISNRNVASEYGRALIGKFFDEFGFKKGKIAELSRTIGGIFKSEIKDRSYLTHRAVLLGLSRYPRVIHNSIEPIAKLPVIDENLEKMREILIDLALSEPEIEQDALEQIWMTQENPPFKQRDLQKDLAYSFYKKHEDPAKPENDLYMVIRAILHHHELDEAIAKTRAALDAEMTETSVEEHRVAVAKKMASQDKIIEAFASAAA